MTTRLGIGLISSLSLATLLSTVTLASPARASDDGLASAELSGQVVQVEVQTRPGADGTSQTLLRLPDGQLTPVDGIDDLASGSVVRLTVDIPRSLEDDVQAEAGRTALDQARTEPAPPSSAVAEAGTEAASTQGVPLQATSVDRVAPAAPAPAAATTAAATPAAQSLTIAAVGVNGYSASAFTDSAVSSLVAATSSYWSGQSNGVITFTQTGAITRYTSSIDCSNSSALWNEGMQRTGFTAGANKHLVLLVPQNAYASGACSYGLGTIGSSVTAGGQVYVADTSWPALAHELGHNMSLWHANELTCGASASDSAFTSSGDPTAAGCSVTEYGDGMDVMGVSAADQTGNLSSVGLTRLGIMPPAQVQTVTVAGATTATLIPLSSGPAASGIRSVVVTDPRNTNVYFLENRQYLGQDTYGWQGIGNQNYNGTTTGYGLRVLKRGEDGASVLLDASPSTPGTFDPDPAVKPGTTFLTASGGILVTTVQNSNGSVTASIDLAAAGQTHGSTSGNTTDAATTSTTLTAPARMLVGNQYAIHGTVSATTTPSGTVSLQIGSGVQSLTLTNGAFDTTYTPAGAGELEISADYDGTSDFDASGDTATVTVVAARSPATISVTAPAVSSSATSARVYVEVSADDAAATGTVRILNASAADVGGGTLNSLGQTRVSLPVPTPGQHAYSVVYSGDDTVTDGSAAVSLTVGRYTSRTTAALARSTITRAQATYVAVTVYSSGSVPATGTVKLVGGRDGLISAAKLSRGKAKLLVPKGMTVGKQTLKVAYYGSSTVGRSSSASMTLRVNR